VLRVVIAGGALAQEDVRVERPQLLPELAHAHPRGVEDEQRQPVDAWHSAALTAHLTHGFKPHPLSQATL
jgi:hypothetical protein